MPRRKSTETRALDTSGAKIGEPVPKAIIDINAASVGIPRRPEQDLGVELSALRKQVDALQQRVLDAGRLAKGSTGKAVRQTEAVVRHYPLSTIVLMAAVAGMFALTAPRYLSPPRHHNSSALRDFRDFYGRMRERI